jgi:hypothetical protein
MTYAIRYRSHARRELDFYNAPYDDEYRQTVYAWFSHLALEAESRAYHFSIDAKDLLDQLEQGANPGNWPGVWKIWQQASWLTKLRALLFVVKQRCPPWEFRSALMTFSVLSGVFPCEVHAWYEVDHLERRIVFTKFTGLPGQ